MININFSLNIIKLDETPSTNDYLLAMTQVGEEQEGTVVVAGHQTGGRGQRGSSWESEQNKNLTLSILFTPIFLDTSRQFMINKIVSLALTDYLDLALGKRSAVSIKWPNDIYVGHQKIAGILTEVVADENTLKQVVVGIGLNINQTVFTSNAPNPVSLKSITGETYDLEKSREELLQCLVRRYIQLQLDQGNLVDGQYLKKLYLFDEYHTYLYRGEHLTAKISSIAHDGKLVLIMPDGIVEAEIKELQFPAIFDPRSNS